MLSTVGFLAILLVAALLIHDLHLAREGNAADPHAEVVLPSLDAPKLEAVGTYDPAVGPVGWLATYPVSFPQPRPMQGQAFVSPPFTE